MIGRRACATVLLALLLVACGGSSSEQSTESVTDDLDRTVTVERPIDRVVTLAPNLTELVYAAGGGQKLVAVTTADDYPPSVDTLDRISALPLDFEALASHTPDLVLATDQVNPPGDSETFEALDVPVYFFSFATLDDVFEALRRIGALLGTEAQAADSARVLEDQIEQVRSETGSIPDEERPRVLVLVGDETLYSFGSGSYVHTMIDVAGGHSITASMETEAPTLTEEYVLTERPDVIIGAWGSDYDPARLEELHPTWDVIPAVQNDRVYSLPPGLLLRPGPRLVEGTRRIAALLHPDQVDLPHRPSSSPMPDTARAPAR